jgi:VWFA-related protein
LLVAAAAARAQTGEVTTREETPTFQSSVNLVRVPVVVRDKQGHAVGNFQRQDFQLTDRGKAQYVSQFAVEGSAVPKPAEQPSAQTEAPAEPAAAGSKLVVPTHFVAFVFDDAHLKLEDLMNARVAALKYIEHGIPPQERIALLTLSGRLSLEFTDDVAKFRETLMKVMPVPPRFHFPPATLWAADTWLDREGGSTDPTHSLTLGAQVAITERCLQLPPQDEAQALRIAIATLREVANDGREDALNAFRILNNIVRLLSAISGERVMVLVSPGIFLPVQLQKELSESIDRATRVGVVINTLDARGVYTENPAGDVDQFRDVPPVCGSAALTIAGQKHNESTAQGMTLVDLAHGTGGTALNQNDFLGEFNRLSNPPEYVYYLGFYPEDLKPDGRYHDIKVTLANGKGLSVQARKGYWAPSREEDAATAAAREIGEAVFSRDELRDLPIAIRTEFFKTSADDAGLTITAHLDIRQLHLRKQDDRSRGDLTLVCALFDGNGNYIKGTQKVVELRLKDENIEERLTHGVNVISDFDVKSGPYMIRIVVRDAEGHQMGAANGVVEIP